MALGSAQPLTEMSTRNLPGGKGQSAHEADSLINVCEPIVYTMLDPLNISQPYRPPRSLTGTAFLFFFYLCFRIDFICAGNEHQHTATHDGYRYIKNKIRTQIA
jgi:hypothetical protein